MPSRPNPGPRFETIYNAENIHTGSGDINSTAIGHQHNSYGAPAANPPTKPSTHIGVITVLRQEARAVVEVLESAEAYRTSQIADGTQVHQATFAGDGGPLRVVTLQTLQPGTHSAIEAYHRLRRHYSPRIVLLVGIAGAIRTGGDPPVEVGDVVIADQVIHYDHRREAASWTHHRGQMHLTASRLQNRLNEFFRVHGAGLRRPDGSWMRLHRGPIGSGNAVITDVNAGNRRWLHEVNEKTVAVDTETAGIAHACHEDAQDGGLLGWLAIRGISDHADAVKGHTAHDLASTRAAQVFQVLLPFLWLADPG